MSLNNSSDSGVHLKYVSKPHIDRIKKQDDEEQWISGEELCTEGSSDDEPNFSTQSPKKSVCRQRKIKKHRMVHSPQKSPNRLSPLVQIVTASSTASKTTNLGDKFAEPVGDSEEIQWRPKRDDFDLLTFVQEIETSYAEMFEKVKSLRSAFDSDDDDEIVQSENLEMYQRDIEKDSRLKEAFDQIFELDTQLRETEIKRKEERRERLEEQVLICDRLIELDKTSKYRKCTKSFLELYKRENEIYKFKKEQTMGKKSRNKSAQESLVDIKSEGKSIKKHKSEACIIKPKHKKNFIAKNVKFASIYGIYHLSLSDEDKEKLLALLEDIEIDDNEDDTELASKSDTVLLDKENNKKKKVKSNEVNPFSVMQDEAISMQNINKKLDIIGSVNWKKTKDIQDLSSDNREENNINKISFLDKRANKKRLKDIDKKISYFTDNGLSKNLIPPSNEQISKLIENCVTELKLETNLEKTETNKNTNGNTQDKDISKHILPKTNTPRNVIDNLLLSVKSQMPNFKYRYTSIREDENKNE